ncbi:uncharacterized protein LOC110101175 [Dendrobium catenatum]|uniref:uncharacterized protein LOC110101175 n=1 Tax=Dendrobium catenatum TaxID=906689 RepID=UPI0009F3DAC7|nr:uncharacterized protein LOC110101175 [Dendrobium catenatum]
MYLLVYVDDILLTGNNNTQLNELIQKLQQRFNLKQLGVAHHFLGIKIRSLPDKLFLSQAHYAQSIINQANLGKCNSVANPSCTKQLIDCLALDLLSDPKLYRRITGALPNLTITRPDIAYAVNMLSQHMHDPTNTNAHQLKRLLRYIQGTHNFDLPITNSNLQLQTFSDADWAGDPITRRSTSGYCTFLGDTLVS